VVSMTLTRSITVTKHNLATSNNSDVTLEQLKQDVQLLLTTIDELQKKHIETAIELGRKLQQIKKIVGHGKWLPWLKANVERFSEDTAENYMKLARYLDDMPDLRPKILDKGLVSALVYLRGEWEGSRNPKVIHRRLCEHLYEASYDLKNIRDGVDRAEWDRYLDSLSKEIAALVHALSSSTSDDKSEFDYEDWERRLPMPKGFTPRKLRKPVLVDANSE